MLRQKEIVNIENNLGSPIDLRNQLTELTNQSLVGVTFTNNVEKIQVLVSPLVDSYRLYGDTETFDIHLENDTLTFSSVHYKVSNIIQYNNYLYNGLDTYTLNGVEPSVFVITTDGELVEVTENTPEHYTILTGVLEPNFSNNVTTMLVF